MNKGVKASSGDILYFLNADDRFADEKVLEDMAAQCVLSKADVLHGDVLYTNVPLKYTGTHLAAHKGDRPINSYHDLLKHLLCHQACFFRRSLFEKPLLFDTRYRIAADFDWMLQTLKAGATFLYIPRPIVQFSVNGKSADLLKTFQETSLIVLHRCGPIDAISFMAYRAGNAFRYLFQSLTREAK
jgi:glycosyltransferase